jgi:hypothetical protein
MACAVKAMCADEKIGMNTCQMMAGMDSESSEQGENGGRTFPSSLGPRIIDVNSADRMSLAERLF